ncbi:hypothetical protein EVAR_99866_1 [Eumeta japonica]|uniref:Ig-like domain-containing protein n=1 Tax=Eumeta variegata TaxID=151549 RepID=A0A4C1ZKS4_EUMVA|nr:hypothetical protein EVAR_99866_1 [Eumeta japonica]
MPEWKGRVPLTRSHCERITNETGKQRDGKWQPELEPESVTWIHRKYVTPREFVYLGSLSANDGKHDRNIERRANAGYIMSGLVWFVSWFVTALAAAGDKKPQFVLEPPARVLWAATRGAHAHCRATGHPTPAVHWLTADGHPLTTIPGLSTGVVQAECSMQLHTNTVFCNFWIRPSKSDQLEGSILDRSNRSDRSFVDPPHPAAGADAAGGCPSAHTLSSLEELDSRFSKLPPSLVGLPHPYIGCRYGTEDLLLPHARASSRRGHDPDGSGGNGPLFGSIV